MRLLILSYTAFLFTTEAMVLPQSRRLRSSTSLALNTPTSMGSDHYIEEMKEDIARMREEAIKRLELLNEQMNQAEVAWKDQKELETSTKSKEVIRVEQVPSSIPTSNSFPTVSTPPAKQVVGDLYADMESQQIESLMKARMERDKLHFLDPVVPVKSSSLLKESPAAANLKLLDNTRWRLMLNVGREPGTWMPKTWGVSGDRLRMHMELEFSPEQLYEREEFLNGVSGAKVLKIVHGVGDLAPSMQHGGKQVRLKGTGGWRVAPNEGPMGTSVLRFYFDLEEETRHPGSDVYCPAGRIYCTCGYFSMLERHQQGHVSEKETLKQEMREIEVQYEALANENELDTDLVSWNKFQRSKKMMDLRMQATKLNTKMHEAHVREPDKALLRLSQDQSVGLTREGGVCCKVHKGLAIEYHILGKFEIASMTNREHVDYRDLLP